jgi:hypothetical protein
MVDDTTPSPINELPCWWVEIDPELCPTETHAILRIERDEFPPIGTTLVSRCAARECQ